MREWKLWHLAVIPSILIIIGYIPVRIFGWDWSAAFWMVSFCLMANWIAIYILIEAAIDMYRSRAYDNQISPPRQPVTVNLNQTYPLTLRPVQIDVERMLATALMSFPDNLTYKYWIESGKWRSMNGRSYKQFQEILLRWEAAGIVARRNPNVNNSPYFVADRHGLARVAAGRYSPSNTSPIGKK